MPVTRRTEAEATDGARPAGRAKGERSSVTSQPSPAHADALRLQSLVGNLALRQVLRVPSPPALAPRTRIQVSRLVSQSEFHGWFATFTAQESQVAGVSGAIRDYHEAETLEDRLKAFEKVQKAVGKLKKAFAPATETTTATSPAGPALAQLKADMKATEKDLIAELESQAKAEEEERKAKEVADVESRLAGNQFNVKSDLKWYGETLPDFTKTLEELRAGDQWMDSGAGLALAMQDYVAKKGEATMVAVAYKKPAEGDDKIAKADVSQLAGFEAKNVDRFSYLSGKYFGEFSKEELSGSGRGYQLITDLNGVLTYTRDLSSDLEKFLNLLTTDPPGKLIAIISATINNDGSGKTLASWLRKNGGVDVRQTGISTWVLTRTSEEEIKLPALKVKSYENVRQSTPARQYKWK